MAATQLKPVVNLSAHWSGSWNAIFWLLMFMVGMRYEVGGDWLNYLDNLDQLQSFTLKESLSSGKDIGYQFISWLSLALGSGIYGVNLMCAVIFAGGLIKLSRAQPYPWLAIAVAIPYLVVVVAMGYTRQAVAIGFLMYGIGYLLRGRIVVYLLFVVLAGLFHKTAIIFAAFALFRPGSGMFKRVLGVVLLVGLAGSAYLVEQAELLMLNYVEHTMESAGGAIRVAMNLPPAFLLLFFWKKWGEIFEDRWLWGLITLLALICVPLVFVASTAVDRLALYLIPLQLVVWARFPVLVQGYIPRIYAILIAITYYAVVQFVWLLYADNASYWLPYDNLLFPSF